MKFLMTIFSFLLMIILRFSSAFSLKSSGKNSGKVSENTNIEIAVEATATVSVEDLLSSESELIPTSNTPPTKGTKKLEENTKNNFKIYDFSLPLDQTVYWEGWVRYYHYNNQERWEKPKLFFQNNLYFNQRIPKDQVNIKDKFGSKIIPNKAAFYLVLYNNTFNIYQHRDDLLRRAVDKLNIDFIESVPEDNTYKGGIKDFGEYKIGSCLELSANSPTEFKEKFSQQTQATVHSYWIICTDKQIEKAKLFTALVKIKVNHQRKNGEIAMTGELMEKKKTIATLMRKQDIIKRNTDNNPNKDLLPKDGYWILLQDWTECTLRCGGGKSFQQWICIPPKYGGKICTGDSIRSRPCNLEPCPDIYQYQKQKNETEVRKPLVHSGRFSERPQRYSKCQIKENDAFLATYDPFKKADDRYPVRVLMNNSTISVYKDESYAEHFYTYDLQDTSLFSDKKSECCYYLKDNFKKTKLCGYAENCEGNKWIKDWEKDFSLFKYTCKVGREELLLTKKDLKEIEDKGKGDIASDEQAKRMQQIYDEQENDQIRKQVKNNQENGFRAIVKEYNIEQMIKKEEQQKEKEELDGLKKMIDEEKKKADCLRKQIEDKDIETIEDKRDIIKDADLAKKAFQRKIEQTRLRLKADLENMRKKQKIKRMELENELKEVRVQMSKNLLNSHRVGDIKNCITGLTNFEFRDDYCNKVFIESYIKNKDCKSDTEFCYMCCEAEFGNFFMQKRYDCYDICDKEEKKLEEKNPDGNKVGGGKWQWAPWEFTNGKTKLELPEEKK